MSATAVARAQLDISSNWESVRLAYQPVHHVACRQPAGAEALLRRINPDGSVSGPESILREVEDTQRDAELAYYLIGMAARQARVWSQAEWLFGYRVGINVSPKVLGQSDFAERVLTILQQESCDPRNILIELVETHQLPNYQCALQQIRELRQAEVLVALDDFGAGHSNVGLLSTLPVDMIKIDPVVFGSEPGRREIQIVSHVVALAQDVGAVVVAEGVENERQWNCVEAAGVDYVQGWLLSRAEMPDALAPGWAPTGSAPCGCWS
ncbi:MAG TPA: hypothetical protein DHW34_03695 [Actinobacteria bacterium]|nr:hypothetical protein [Actinomycetota bacterium]